MERPEKLAELYVATRQFDQVFADISVQPAIGQRKSVPFMRNSRGTDSAAFGMLNRKLHLLREDSESLPPQLPLKIAGRKVCR